MYNNSNFLSYENGILNPLIVERFVLNGPLSDYTSKIFSICRLICVFYSEVKLPIFVTTDSLKSHHSAKKRHIVPYPQ